MTRAQRFAVLASISALVYLLLAYSVIPFPLLPKDVSDQLIPVVRFELQFVLLSTVWLTLHLD